jgi:hypothetical protein
MRPAQKAMLLCCGLLFTSAMGATNGDGLKAPSGDLTWARWQARFSLGATAPAWRASLTDPEPAGLRVNAISVSGDYYITQPLFNRLSLGGLRATGGLIVGPRAQATTGQPALGARGSSFAAERRLLAAAAPGSGETTSELASVPYFSFGYTGLSLRGTWSFSADLGVVALQPGNAVRLGRVIGGTQSFDDVWRDLRWAPVLQMGVSYAF